MANPIKDVAGSTIVITGASSGFGRGAALRLAGLGAYVVLAARRTQVLEELAQEIESAGGEALVVTTDVSNSADVSRLAEEALQRFGKIDVWVSNTGIGALGLFWDIPLADYDRVIDVNLKGVVYCAHVALTALESKATATWSM